jgi:hypothetical protein
VAWWENKVTNKIQTLAIEPAAYDGGAVLLAKLRKIIRIDDFLLQTSCLNSPAFQPPLIDPSLHLFDANV